jgi:hypothetical protein
MFLEDIDLSKPIPKPQLFICKNDLARTTIANLSEAYNTDLSLKFGGIHELNFTVPFEIEYNNALITNPNINKLLYKYIIKLKLDSYEDYFIIDKPKDNMTDSDDVKSITCYSLAYELKDKMIRNFIVDSKSISQLFSGFTDEISSITYPSILSETNWSLGYVDSSASLLYRGFNISSATLLDFLFEIADAFGCIIIFDNKNKIINFYDPLKIGTYKGLNFQYGRLLQNLEVEPDFENTCTRLKLFGAEEISINDQNPTGSNYLESYQYFIYPFERDENRNVIKSSNYLSDSLCHALLDYSEKIKTKETDFSTFLSQKETKQQELITLENQLFELESGEDGLVNIKNNIDLAQSSNNYYDDLITYPINSLVLYNNIAYQCIVESTDNLPTNEIYWVNLVTKKQNKELEITSKNTEITNKNTEISDIDAQILILKDSLSMESNFTSEQITELNNYIIVKELSNENISDSKDLIKWGKEQFVKIITPIINAKVSTENILSLLEYQDQWDKFLPTNLGDIVKIFYDRMNIEIEAKIVEFNFNFENQECSLGISNSKSLSDDKQKFIEELNKAISTSTTVDMNKYKFSEIPQLTSEINRLINEKWDANRQAIVAGDNENYSLDRFGLTLKSPTDSLNFLRGLHNILAFTNDAGNTYKNALTPQGLVAESVFGKLICGVNLQIDASDEEGNKFFEVNSQGVKIQDLDLTITSSTNTSRILANAEDGLKLQKNTE